MAAAETHQLNEENLIDPIESSISKSFNDTILKLLIIPTCKGSLTKLKVASYQLSPLRVFFF